MIYLIMSHSYWATKAEFKTRQSSSGVRAQILCSFWNMNSIEVPDISWGMQTLTFNKNLSYFCISPNLEHSYIPCIYFFSFSLIPTTLIWVSKFLNDLGICIFIFLDSTPKSKLKFIKWKISSSLPPRHYFSLGAAILKGDIQYSKLSFLQNITSFNDKCIGI
jgi:hypothetical protein